MRRVFLLIACVGIFLPSSGESSWSHPTKYPCVTPLFLYGTTNGGWDEVIASDPSNPDIVYLGTVYSLYKSEDGGLNWRKINGFNGLPRFIQVTAIAVDPVNPSTLYVGVNYDGSAGRAGLYRSTDGGLTWTQLFSCGEAYVECWITSILIDPSNPDVIYFVMSDSTSYSIYPSAPVGVYKSTDGGLTWQLKNNGFNPIYQAGGMVMDPNNPSVLYVSIETQNYQVEHYKSTDGGETWVLTDFPVGVLAINPYDSNVMYGGAWELYKSVDGGESWTMVLDPYMSVTDLVIDPNNPDILYVGTDDWIYKSVDGGSTWQKLPHIIAPYYPVGDLYVDAVSNLYALSWGGGHLFKSEDGGYTWSIRDSGIREFYVGGGAARPLFHIYPSDPPVLYIASDTAIARSLDGGMTWEYLPGPDNLPHMASIHVVNPDVVFAGIIDFPPPSGRFHTLWKSTDGGHTWSQRERTGGTNGFAPWAFAFSLTNPSIMFSGGDGSIYKSTDYGDTWTLMRFGDGADVMDIEIDPTNENIVYFVYGNNGTSNPETGVWKSTDGGNTWFQVSNGIPKASNGLYCTIEDLEINPLNPDILYVGLSKVGMSRGSQCYGIFKSTDGGASWKRVDIPYYSWVADIELDPSDPNIIYAAQESHFIIRSPDGGLTWEDIPVGDEYYYPDILAIEIAPTIPRKVYLGALRGENGLYLLTLPPSPGMRPVEYCEPFPPDTVRVYITYPENYRYSPTWTITGNSFTVFADYLTMNYKDIDHVLFQYRIQDYDVDLDLPEIPWEDIPPASSHPNPDYTYPYFVHFDMTGLDETANHYEVRAIAYHKNGKEDIWVLRSPFVVNHTYFDEKQYINGSGELVVEKAFWSTEENRLLAGHPSKELYDEFFLSGSGLPADDTVIYVMENPDEHEGKVPVGLRSIGEFRSISFASGLTSFINGIKATLRIGYPDSDQDGKVDGMGISETSLKVYRFISGTEWEELPSTVLKDTNQVEVKVDHLSLFAILIPSQAVPARTARPVACGGCSRRGRVSSAFIFTFTFFYGVYMRIRYRRG